ncbi:MAG: acyl-CoA dehydrogenase family protein [Fimbriimonadales bacterium]|nr:acyl-CoA dehydrogenase family protein [Fimbriimonadales bacterium]
MPTPVEFLEGKLGAPPCADALHAYQNWWETTGRALSETIDRAGTPWLRPHNRFGERVDEVLTPEGYVALVQEGYRHGAVWRVIEQSDWQGSFALGYITAYYDAGLYCPHTVSLSTAVPLLKYGAPAVREQYLPHMLRRDGAAWQGATWMTEAGGGSDLGANVKTVAIPDGNAYRLTGEKYFCSNVNAELAVVAARPQGAPDGIRGLALFLVPRYREDGSLNYFIRRIKDKIGTRSVVTGEVELRDSVGYLLGSAEVGVYLILEVLNISRVANSVGSVALLQRAIDEAAAFAQRRIAFGKPLMEQPLMRRQFTRWRKTLDAAFALAWECVRLLAEVGTQPPPYSPRYHLFRLLTHLAKYWTAEQAVQAAKWCMEVHGGAGVLAEFGVERLLREAMVLPIWEGGSHRQMLDALEVMQRRSAHTLLLEHLAPVANPAELQQWRERLEGYLQQPPETQEAELETLIPPLAAWVGATLSSV